MGGGGVNKGSEFYKFRPLGKKKCYCYAKKSGVENIFPEQFRGVPDSNFCPGKFMGETFECEKGGFTGRGGCFLGRGPIRVLCTPPKPQSELGAPPPKGPFNGNVTGGYQIPIFAREKNVDPP